MATHACARDVRPEGRLATKLRLRPSSQYRHSCQLEPPTRPPKGRFMAPARAYDPSGKEQSNQPTMAKDAPAHQ
eukprot:7760948-Heterocapsa_arctica.AAC.1